MIHPKVVDERNCKMQVWFVINAFKKYFNILGIEEGLPYARHYKPRLVFFFTQFSLQLRLILKTIYVLKTEILHFLSLKSAAYKWERLQIKSGLWWRAYGNKNTLVDLLSSVGSKLRRMLPQKSFHPIVVLLLCSIQILHIWTGLHLSREMVWKREPMSLID